VEELNAEKVKRALEIVSEQKVVTNKLLRICDVIQQKKEKHGEVMKI